MEKNPKITQFFKFVCHIELDLVKVDLTCIYEFATCFQD